MRQAKTYVWGAMLLFSSATLLFADHGKSDVDLALSGKGKEAAAAISRLRAAGPESLKILLSRRADLEEAAARQARTDVQADYSSHLTHLDEVIDQVGGAKYCSASRLYWYTDLEQAKAVAHKSGKPILALRMLGNLTDEFSCANSRFFRTTLYANAEISKVLREKFVLHWRSVRPVPKVTIDFGDGRKLERTLTGNSIHYVLAADGTVLEAIPGLYGPQAFLRHLQRGEALARLMAEATPERRGELLLDYHQLAAEELDQQWEADWQKAQRALALPPRASASQSLERMKAALAGSPSVPLSGQPAAQAEQRAPVPPRAEAAAEVAIPKRKIERKMIEAVNLVKAAPDDVQDEKAWNLIASFHAEESRLDSFSKKVIRGQNPVAAAAGRLSRSKSLIEDPVLKMLVSYEASIALDSVRNEYLIHRRIHEWFCRFDFEPEVEKLNERVYAELFLTPSSDPWLGLAPEDVYTALPNGGVVAEAAE